ncbi:unnamed protein product (macronuclear) [Paramecium tetraurelia]|uniref:Transmembrane protein n=1 Tax=Paramecium tetraurelia TaxID=5888 RepID=A0BV29_PARTE|nr:uncharacterized protein GSPATT00005642001 [Paramecium tetraurelia]CAK62396.1 unnamed protein product [Paramecium tetraurelia]|eukprot:XP_001429794.1 hypothetical protein (macronuclear) [Paramecium tetraurelia strain d4-2]
MFHSYLFNTNRNPMQEYKPGQTIKNYQKNQLPQLSKYIESEIMKRSFEKEQERRKSLQQQSNQIEKEIQNKLFLKERVNQKERDLFVGQRHSVIVNAAKIKPQKNFNELNYQFNQFSTVNQKQINSTFKDEASNRERSITFNIKNQRYQHFNLLEEEIPVTSKNKMIDCNQVLDFRISVDSKNTYSHMGSRQGRQIPNYINFFQSRFDKPYQLAKEEYEKKIQQPQNIFKQWGLICIFIFRLIKRLRQKKVKFIQNIKDLRARVDALNQEKIEEIKIEWFEKLMQNLLQTIQSSSFSQHFKQTQNPNDKKFILKRKQWIMNFSQLFFQNLFEMTKALNFNKEILLLAQYHILQINKKGSLFVAKRIRTKQIKNEQILVICDYIFFSFIIEKIIQQSNQIVCINDHHLAESKFQLVSICSLIQILFMNHFKEMQRYQPNISKIIQKKLNVSKNKYQDLNITEDEVIEQNENIIQGLNNFEFYENLIKQNQKWYQDISTLFGNCVTNLASQNNI